MTIPYGRQSISEDDIEAVIDILRSDFLTQGPAVPAFERHLAEYCGARHGVAVNSATSALHIACLALGVGPGDLVWTSPISFVASANCALYCGADVDFVDIDADSRNMDMQVLRAKLKKAEAEGRLPQVVIPVHMCGQSCDMKTLSDLSRIYGFRIIEDASHAVGGRYLGQPVGNCTFSDITVFSFHPVKIITSAEGGMAITNEPMLAEKMAQLRSHGITRDKEQMRSSSPGEWYYEQNSLGYNYRMTELQAALGLSQAARLDEFVARRHEIADQYDTALAHLPLILPKRTEDAYSSLHLYVIRVDRTRGAADRATVFSRLRADGIGVQVHYFPIHLQPYYADRGFKAGQFPAAEKYYADAISIPMYPTLEWPEQKRVVQALERALIP